MRCSFSEPVRHSARAAPVIVDLAGRAIQVAVMKEKFQSAEDLLRAATHEGRHVVGAQESMTTDVTKDLSIPRGQSKWRDLGRT